MGWGHLIRAADDVRSKITSDKQERNALHISNHTTDNTTLATVITWTRRGMKEGTELLPVSLASIYPGLMEIDLTQLSLSVVLAANRQYYGGP